MADKDNAKLYAAGLRYARWVDESITPGVSPADALTAAADKAGAGVKEARIAYDFYRHVEKITTMVQAARGLILAGTNPHLTPSVLQGMANRTPKGIRTAMERAAAGLHPFAPDPPDGSPNDLAAWDYDLRRLREARRLLEQAATSPARRPRVADRADLSVHTLAVAAVAAVAAVGHLLGDTPARPSWVSPPRVEIGGQSAVVESLVKCRRRVEEAVGDLLRAAHTRPLPAAVRDELGELVRAIIDAAGQVRARFPAEVVRVTPPGVEPCDGGPSSDGGTYAVVLSVEAAGVKRLGRLGTFRLPAGFLVYVGSAFQAGGVAARTTRHREGSGPRVWQLDDLRGFARPVGLWWTHHREKVEHAWARALAGLRAYSCPAPLAGASDCNQGVRAGESAADRQRCPAHLLHTPDPPDVREFAAQLGRSGSGGYTLYFRPEHQGDAQGSKKDGA